MDKRLLGVEEAAQYLGIQKGTLYCWAHKRMISTVKMGRRLLFDRNDLDDHIEQGKRPSTAILTDSKSHR